MCQRDGWGRKLRSFIPLLEAGIFFLHKKREVIIIPSFEGNRQKDTGVKLPQTIQWEEVLVTDFPPHEGTFPSLVFASLIWENFSPKAKHEQLFSGKWRLNFTWRFLPAWSSGTQVSGPASVSWHVSLVADRWDSVLWKVPEMRRKWSQVSRAVQPTLMRRGDESSRVCLHCWNFCPNEKKRPPQVLHMPRAAPKRHLHSTEESRGDIFIV